MLYVFGVTETIAALRDTKINVDYQNSPKIKKLIVKAKLLNKIKA